MQLGPLSYPGKGIRLLRWALLSIWLTQGSVYSAVPLQVGGTDYLEAPFERVVTELSEGTDASLAGEILVNLNGTTPARRGLESGHLEMALIFQREENPTEIEGYERLPLGYQIIQVLVHESNPLDSIRVNRLTGIFGSAEEFDFNRWGDLGLMEWADRTMVSYYVSGEVNLSTEYFREAVMTYPHFKISAVESPSRSSLLDSIRSEANAIGLSGYVGDAPLGVKVLALSSDATETPVVPNPESVHFGDYPLRIPLFLYFRSELLDRIRPLLILCYSNSFRGDLVESGMVPIPQSVQDQILLDLSLGK